jgi:hypothetical protein
MRQELIESDDDVIKPKKTQENEIMNNTKRVKRSGGRKRQRRYKSKSSNYNMINKINKERRRSMNVTPTRPSNKSQWQGAQEDPKQKQDRATSKVPELDLEKINLGKIENVAGSV